MSQKHSSRVAVIDGGWSHEANYSSAPFIISALKTLGYEVISLRSEAGSFLRDLLAAQPDLVLPQCLGAYGEDGGLAALLERYDIRYVGSGVGASAVGMNKALCKIFVRGLQLAGVTAPASLTLSPQQHWPSYEEVVARFGSPVVLKPLSSGASFGLHIIDEEAAWYPHLASTLAEFRYVLVEPLVSGREFALGILEDDQQVFDLPVCEVLTAGRGYTQDAKCVPGTTNVPADLDSATTRSFQAVARTIFTELGCRSFLRVDVIQAPDGAIHVLEINTLPGLIPTISAYPKMCQAAGLSYEAMIQRLIQSARRPVPFQMPKLFDPPPLPAALLTQDQAVREAQTHFPGLHANIHEEAVRWRGTHFSTDALRDDSAHENGSVMQATEETKEAGARAEDQVEAHPCTAARSPFAIEMHDLSKRFGRRKVVEQLSLQVEQGEIFGLLGPNGSGKSTTINMISGLLRPTSGTVRVLGHDIQQHPRDVWRKLGVVSQETALYEELTAWHNLDFHADLYGVPRQEKEERIWSMLDLIQLRECAHGRVKTFSGGMKRRLAIARALLHHPDVLYLDEPTLGVDVQSRAATWDYIRALKSQGKTVLLTTNYLEEAAALCDRLAIIDHGQLLVLASPGELRARYGSQIVELTLAEASPALEMLSSFPGVQQIAVRETQVRITMGGAESVGTLAQVLSHLAVETSILEVQVREPNLDEIFLELTGTALRD